MTKTVPDAPGGTSAAAATDRHVLAVPTSDEQLWEMSARFVAEGLAAGEQVSYFDDGTADCVLERLRDDGVPIEDGMRRGQFRVVPAEFTRAALLAPLDELEGLLEQNIAAAVDAGWAGLRFTGQMSHGLTRPGGVVLPEYDAVLDAVVRERPVTALCVYDHARFPADLIAHMRRTHEHETQAPSVYDDGLLRVTSAGPVTVRLAGQIDRSNRQEVDRVLTGLLDEALRTHTAPTAVTVGLASLRFVDVAAAARIVHAAEEFPSTHRLVLTDVRPGVARVLERCGSTFAPQLDLRAHPRTEGPTCTAPFHATPYAGPPVTN